ncbi:hypothetical protein CHS0354_026833 [Potamilus streckersoni]|uniref:Uncharacterized protein n=1 Tax=Potamilus streckersoni TaxID=2493646 RepID=A0AAE0T569_9BIVA|nr:hypothetical protein CHS0354_026833 [Potamilus streckersoni]
MEAENTDLSSAPAKSGAYTPSAHSVADTATAGITDRAVKDNTASSGDERADAENLFTGRAGYTGGVVKGSAEDYIIRDLPEDFTERAAYKLITIYDGQLTRSDAVQRMLSFSKKHINSPQMYQEMFKVMLLLQEYENMEKVADLYWSSLLWDYEADKVYFNKIIRWLITANREDLKMLDLQFKDEKTNYSRRFISDAVIVICETCLLIAEANKQALDLIKYMFTIIYNLEADIYNFKLKYKNSPSFIDHSLLQIKQGEQKNSFMFNDIIRYFSLCANGYYSNRQAAHTQHNARRIFETLTAHKRFLVQGMLDRIAVESKAADINIQKNRHTNPEEMEAAYTLFKVLLESFREELRFNPHYVMTEYMRVFIFIFCMTLGFIGGIMGLVGLDEMTPLGGLVVVVLMIGYTVVVHSRRFYMTLLPEDRYYDIQQGLPVLCSYMERFSMLQFQDFIERQIEDKENAHTFAYIPSFLHFVTSVYNKNFFMFISRDEIRKLLYQSNEKITKIRWNTLNR